MFGFFQVLTKNFLHLTKIDKIIILEFPDFRNLKNCSKTHFFQNFYIGFSPFQIFFKQTLYLRKKSSTTIFIKIQENRRRRISKLQKRCLISNGPYHIKKNLSLNRLAQEIKRLFFTSIYFSQQNVFPMFFDGKN
jgi:hypothetical protein